MIIQKYFNYFFKYFQRNKPPLKTIQAKRGYCRINDNLNIVYGETQALQEILEIFPIELNQSKKYNVHLVSVDKCFYSVYNSTTNTLNKFTNSREGAIDQLTILRSNNQSGWIKRVYPSFYVVTIDYQKIIIQSTHPIKLNYLIMEY